MENTDVEANQETSLQLLLAQSSRFHRHLCPRQVLGVRMGLLAGKLLDVPVPQTDKRLFVFVETDGCASTGVSVATGCWVGRRTMQVMDFGKVAITVVDTKTDNTIRIYPHPKVRQHALDAYPHAKSRWHSQLQAYQTLADDDLLVSKNVSLTVDLHAIISRAGVRVNCDECGEEVINQREIKRDNQILCKSCAGFGYYSMGDQAT